MDDACCDPLMDLQETRSKQRRILWVVFGINVATFVMVVAGSFLSGSTALLSGGLDNFGDALTYVLSLTVLGASSAAKARTAMFKGALIALAAVAVAAQIVWKLLHPGVPIFETMGLIALLNLGANAVCFGLITPFRRHDVNMSSAWECSRNDLYEGAAVIVAAGLVLLFDAAWPDLAVATILLLLFSRSAAKVLSEAREQLAETRRP